MAIKVQCPHCGTTFSAQDSYHGKKIKCPKCGTKFQAFTAGERKAIEKRKKYEETAKTTEEAERESQFSKIQEREAFHCAGCGRALTESQLAEEAIIDQNGRVYCLQCYQRDNPTSWPDFRAILAKLSPGTWAATGVVVVGLIIMIIAVTYPARQRRQLQEKRERELALEIVREKQKRLSQERRRKEEERRRQRQAEGQRAEAKRLRTSQFTAASLYEAYKDNEFSADSRYKGRILTVYGRISQIGRGLGSGDPYVTLAVDEDLWWGDTYCSFSWIMCKFARGRENDLKELHTGDWVTVVGECTGKLLSSVILKNCDIR
jgi:predicted Zn finger-like uncharacterized protein